ncbi:MAG: TIGR04255 family protein [Thermoguttaceae bacterium]
MNRPKLPRSPLVLVAAQVRFSPIEDVQKYIKTIQDDLRTAGFPYCEQSTVPQITVMGGQGFQVSQAEQWHFADKKKQNNIVLSKNAITVHSVNYDTFDQFLLQVLESAKKVSVILQLPEFGLLERTSLRYVNLMYPLDGVAPEKMIQSEYTGGFIDGNNEVQLRQVIMERKTSEGMVRTIILKPNDLNNVLGEFQAIRLNQPKFTQGKDFLILDIDHQKPMQGEDFSIDLVHSVLKSLHDEVDVLFFEKITTKEALAIWGKESE